VVLGVGVVVVVDVWCLVFRVSYLALFLACCHSFFYCCTPQPGSSAQILVGLVIALGFFTVLLRTQPYVDDDDDQLQSIATGSIVMTLLIGFTLKINAQNQVEAGTAGDYDEAFMDFILIGLFALVGVSGLYIQAKTLPCFARCCVRKTKVVGNETMVKKMHDASFGQATATSRPTRQLSRRLTMGHIQQIVVHNNVKQIQKNHKEHLSAHIEKIKQRERVADARVRLRLAKRRTKKDALAAKKAMVKKDTHQWNIPSEEDNEAELKVLQQQVETLRVSIASELNDEKMLVKVFKKVDQNNNGTLSRKELDVLVFKITKQKPDPALMRGVWQAAQAMRKGSHAVPNEEISLDTLRFFLTMATTTATAEVANVSDWQKLVDPGSGHPYWYNATTKASSWTAPT
jgi:hypothetical protein